MFFMISRQGYYQSIIREGKTMFDQELIVKRVQELRYDHPRMGGKKLYYLMQQDMDMLGVKMGRDKFFDLLRTSGLLVKRRRKYVITTQSHHRYRVYGNVLKGALIKSVNRAWVCDITYIRIRTGFMYLFLITDVFSRKIVGWHLSNNQTVASGLKALQMALNQTKKTAGIIHHSDRGFQYCSPAYVKILLDNQIIISMGEAGNCYDNALAERVNGILKNEYNLEATFPDQAKALKAIKHGIKCYNEKRPHWSLNLKIPNEIHQAA